MVANTPCQPVVTTPSPSETRPRIVLIGNYSPDAQVSMQRFAQVLFAGLQRSGCHVEWLVPPVVFGRWGKSTIQCFGKWLGYIDKYLIFPSRLSRAMRGRKLKSDGPIVIHICDHSNAVYTGWTHRIPTVVTCHDLLAVRGALGEQTDCPASVAGRQLQRWIVRGLKRASAIVSVSRATMRDVDRIVGLAHEGQNRRLIHMGLNHGYRRLEPDIVETRLTGINLPQGPFILHVGSNLRRKNRDGVLRIFSQVADRWKGSLVFAGEPLNEELWTVARSLGIDERVVVISKPESSLLEALYNRAMALVFPSRFEGFGWPVIEAQASGCPVICSNAGPLPEIVGDGGIICPLDDEEAFASAILRLTEPVERESFVLRGLANVQNFTTEQMIDDYLSVYEELGVRK